MLRKAQHDKGLSKEIGASTGSAGQLGKLVNKMLRQAQHDSGAQQDNGALAGQAVAVAVNLNQVWHNYNDWKSFVVVSYG